MTHTIFLIFIITIFIKVKANPWSDPSPTPLFFDEYPFFFEIPLNDSSNAIFNGISASDYSGYSVSSAGDVNNDTYDDFLIGAYYGFPDARGEAYLIYGGPSLSSPFDISILNSSTGVFLNGDIAADRAGNSVSAAGDVNNDGYADFLIGASQAGPLGRTGAGTTYLIFGGPSLPGTIELSTLNNSSLGMAIYGLSMSDQSGFSVSSAGDVNNDGFDDFIIGAKGANPFGSNFVGQAFLIYGASSFNSTLDLSLLNETTGMVINGIDTNDYCGASVSGAGDVNMDGFDDLIIGAYGADPNGGQSGESYIVYGNSSLPPVLNLTSLNSSTGMYINGIAAGDASGYSVSSAGDFNGDGYDDILIGAYLAGSTGESYVVFGGPTLPLTFQLSNLNQTTGIKLFGYSTISGQIGYSVSSAGDVNGDGFSDIILGAPFTDVGINSDAGRVYLVYGSDSLPVTLNLSAMNGTYGAVLNGVSPDDVAGYSCSGAGDVNNDGYSDIIVGAWQADPNGSNSGQSYVVYGPLPCPFGYFLPQNGTSPSNCSLCPLGTYGTAIGVCTVCAPDFFGNETNSCISCPIGWHSLPGTVSACSIKCPIGTSYSYTNETTYECVVCPANTFGSSIDVCQSCPSGLTSKAGAIACSPNGDDDDTDLMTVVWTLVALCGFGITAASVVWFRSHGKHVDADESKGTSNGADDVHENDMDADESKGTSNGADDVHANDMEMGEEMVTEPK